VNTTKFIAKIADQSQNLWRINFKISFLSFSGSFSIIKEKLERLQGVLGTTANNEKEKEHLLSCIMSGTTVEQRILT
jgi:hypothetical protein